MLEKSAELSSPRDVGLSHEVLGNTTEGTQDRNPANKGQGPTHLRTASRLGQGHLGKGRSHMTEDFADKIL